MPSSRTEAALPLTSGSSNEGGRGALSSGNRAAWRGAGTDGTWGASAATSRKNGTPSATARSMNPSALRV